MAHSSSKEEFPNTFPTVVPGYHESIFGRAPQPGVPSDLLSHTYLMFNPKDQRPRRKLFLSSQERDLSKKACSQEASWKEFQSNFPFSPIIITWPAWKGDVERQGQY